MSSFYWCDDKGHPCKNNLKGDYWVGEEEGTAWSKFRTVIGGTKKECGRFLYAIDAYFNQMMSTNSVSLRGDGDKMEYAYTLGRDWPV